MARLDLDYPSIEDLRRRARHRVPHFAFEYLDSATGREMGAVRNRQAFDKILFMPAILRGPLDPDLSATVLGRCHPLPFGIAPVGLSGLIWPAAERILAQSAARSAIPYCQSTVAVASPEEIGPHVADNGWFQHYPVVDPAIRRDMLKRISVAGFGTLVVTVDVPGESRRERQRRAHVSAPPRLTPKVLLAMLMRPHWCLAMALEGSPRMKFVESYAASSDEDSFVHAGRVIRGSPDWDYLRAVRDEWSGDLVVKGVMEASDAAQLRAIGVDAIWVSNHSARQFEGGPAPIHQLPIIRDALGPDMSLIYDSGVRGGLDIMRAIALGADFVFLGAPFHYAVGALGRKGPDHLIHILKADLISCMRQIGAGTLPEIASRLIDPETPPNSSLGRPR